MINIVKGKTGEVSFLHISEETSFQQPKPTVIFIHGFQSAKEHNLHYAYLLAEKGFRVILPDCIHHGDRDNNLSSVEMMQAFWEIVIQSINEIEIVKEYLIAEGLSEIDSIGVAGTSMGAIVTFGALKKYPWIRAAVSLMGCPYYQEFAKWQIEKVAKTGIVLPFNEAEIELFVGRLAGYDLSNHPEKMNERPLLCWHGSKDQEVPAGYVIEFVNEIKGYYKKKPENIKLMIDERAEHKVSREGVSATVQWFATHLKSRLVSSL
ncbi:prolyl oligopeptidase family serine peptidase [Sutcliffiella deserti]|uniref:prolyl oligopeptidase family serine peptidase n=1 Tax=Sutcliffiella deserti TaxID=2875501 RepID=UPI001CBB5337|nr:prolyl oligopeptidase family serine peptidase [Sutcliffiella deserti]